MKGMNREELRKCTIGGCTLNHYENCPRCWGFGFDRFGWIVNAGYVFKIKKEDEVICNNCGGSASKSKRV